MNKSSFNEIVSYTTQFIVAVWLLTVKMKAPDPAAAGVADDEYFDEIINAPPIYSTIESAHRNSVRERHLQGTLRLWKHQWPDSWRQMLVEYDNLRHILTERVKRGEPFIEALDSEIRNLRKKFSLRRSYAIRYALTDYFPERIEYAQFHARICTQCGMISTEDDE